METRIRRNIIILVVVTFLVLIGMSAGWFFVLVRPQREEIARTETQYEELKTKASGLDKALKDKQVAEDRLNYLKGQLVLFRGGETNRAAQGLYRRLYFGDVAGDSAAQKAALDVLWRSWMNEYHYQFGPTLQAELKRAEAASQVALTMPAIKVDDPPQTPEDAKSKIPTNGFLKPLSATNNGTLSLEVAGTFQNILRFLENINRSSILMVVGQIKLEGYSPNIKATFPITVYLVASGPGAPIKATSGAAPGGEGGGDGEGEPTPPTPPPTQNQAVVAKIKNPRTQASMIPAAP